MVLIVFSDVFVQIVVGVYLSNMCSCLGSDPFKEWADLTKYAREKLLPVPLWNKHFAIEFSRDSQTFLVASDAAFADNTDRKSTEGYLFMLFGGPIDWRTT
jgi:hypothetical protein